MKKTVAIALSGLFAVASLAGCSSDKKVEEVPVEEEIVQEENGGEVVEEEVVEEVEEG